LLRPRFVVRLVNLGLKKQKKIVNLEGLVNLTERDLAL